MTYAQNCTVALVFGRGRPIEGADLRRFDKHKKTPPVRNCTFFCGTQGIEVWMGKHPKLTYTIQMELQNSFTGSSLI